MSIAYPYIRVSTKAQDSEESTGLKAQLQSIEKFIKDKEFNLSDKYYSDTASGYYGANQKDDAGLGKFLIDCENGTIKAGDMLCVHKLDRLCRLPPDDARELFKRIQDYGVKVAIVRWNLIIDKNENKINLSSDLILTVGFHLAHMESQQKSERVKDAKQIQRDRAREGARTYTKNCPAWMLPTVDKTAFEVDKQDQEIINRIFQLKVAGYGALKTLGKLRDEFNKPTIRGKDIQLNFVGKVIRKRTVLGEWQPKTRTIIKGKRVERDSGEPIKGYYPQIISEELFNAAQGSFNNSSRGIASKAFNNILVGLIVCPECGSALTRRVSKVKNGTKAYLRCLGSVNKRGCTQTGLGYIGISKAILNNLEMIDFKEIFKGEQQDNDLILMGLEGDILKLQREAKNYGLAIGQAENDEDITDLMESRRVATNETVIKQKEVAALKLAMKESDISSITDAAKLDLSSEDDRRKINIILKKYLKSITISDKGRIEIFFKQHISDTIKIILAYNTKTELSIDKFKMVQIVDDGSIPQMTEKEAIRGKKLMEHAANRLSGLFTEEGLMKAEEEMNRHKK